MEGLGTGVSSPPRLCQSLRCSEGEVLMQVLMLILDDMPCHEGSQEGVDHFSRRIRTHGVRRERNCNHAGADAGLGQPAAAQPGGPV